MTHSNGHKKAHAFKGAAALMIAALLAVLLFTGCSELTTMLPWNNIEGVWKVVSIKQVATDGTEYSTSTPIDLQNGSKVQPYYCFSKGKAYMAGEVTGNPNSAQNGLFLDDDGIQYTLKNNTLTIQSTPNPTTFNITIKKNTLTMTGSSEYGTTVMTFTKVKSPTAAQIKAAKKNEPPTS